MRRSREHVSVERERLGPSHWGASSSGIAHTHPHARACTHTCEGHLSSPESKSVQLAVRVRVTPEESMSVNPCIGRLLSSMSLLPTVSDSSPSKRGLSSSILGSHPPRELTGELQSQTLAKQRFSLRVQVERNCRHLLSPELNAAGFMTGSRIPVERKCSWG